MCVCEREREIEREKKREIETGRERERQRETRQRQRDLKLLAWKKIFEQYACKKKTEQCKRPLTFERFMLIAPKCQDIIQSNLQKFWSNFYVMQFI